MTIEIIVEGQRLEGFEEGSVNLTMTEAVASFEISYVPENPEERYIFAGDEVEVRLDGDVLIGGYADETEETFEPTNLRVRAVGFSKAVDLVDSSAIQPPGSWANATLDRIVSDLCAPFEITAFVVDPGKPFEAFSVHKGESVYDAIARGALKRGLVVYSVGNDLMLARAGKFQTATVLEQGVNIERAMRRDSLRNRYSQYVFAGQARPDDETWGDRTQQLKHIVVDDRIRRFRPLRVNAETGSGLDLEHRALLERNQRAGRGETMSITVLGHKTDEGYAWRPNLLVPVRHYVLGVDARLLVTSATLRVGPNEAEATDLELARPEAFDLGKYPALGRGGMWT